MAADVPFLHPTNSSIVSYALHGMSYDTPLPELRIVANTPWSELSRDLNGLMSASCMGLMSNQTALDMLKVCNTCLRSGHTRRGKLCSCDTPSR